MDITIYHNPRCSNSRGALDLIRSAGIEPRIVEYLKTPPSRAVLAELLTRAGLTPRQAIRTKEAIYEELRLDDAADDDALGNGIGRDTFANDIFTERRALPDGNSAVRIYLHRGADNDACRGRDANGHMVLRLRRDRCAHGARDCCNGKYPVSHGQLLREDARRLAPARNPIQFIARSIVP